MEKTEPLVLVWQCVKCKHTEFREGLGPHICTQKIKHRDLFGDEEHEEYCRGRMEVCPPTDTDAKTAEK